MHSVESDRYPDLVVVGCVNFASAYRDKSATLAKMERHIRDAARQGCNIVAFPELALHNIEGQCMDCGGAGSPCDWHFDQAETVPGPSTERIAALAAELDLYVIFGLEERDPDDPRTIYNSSAVVGPEGILGTFRKIHLGIPLETCRFSPGDRLPVWETRYGPIGVLICYDFWSNPELSRILAMKGARLLINTTASADAPDKYDYVVDTTVVRAQENIVYAASANRVDQAGNWGPGAGGSVIAGPAFPSFNKVFAKAGRGEELIVATLNFRQLARWYDLFPWSQWRLGEQMYATELVAREFTALTRQPRNGAGSLTGTGADLVAARPVAPDPVAPDPVAPR